MDAVKIAARVAGIKRTAAWSWVQIHGALKALGVEIDPQATFMPLGGGFEVKLKDGKYLRVTIGD